MFELIHIYFISGFIAGLITFAIAILFFMLYALHESKIDF
jgi:hypothetical protein